MIDVLQTRIPIDLGDGAYPIAMVDDEALDHELAKRFHKRSKLNNPLVHYCDGASFIKSLDDARTTETPLPAVVLMDINMPGMDGFETVQTMRRDTRFKTMPVVMMLTSSNDPRDRERASEVGADGYLIKPFNPRCYLDFFNSLAGD